MPVWRVQYSCGRSVQFGRSIGGTFPPANAFEHVPFRKRGIGTCFFGAAATRLRIALGCLGALTVWFATSCAVQAQTGTLTAGSVGTTTAELSIGNWSGPWWHNYTSPFGGTCSPVVSAGTSTVGLTGLSGNTPYTFHAFNNQFCAGLPIATAPAFVTKPGKPATPSASAAAAGGDDLTLSSSVSGSGAVSKWQYRHREGSGSFGDWTDIAVASRTLSHTVYGLAGGSVHQFRVRAVNAAGAGLESDASAAVSPLERTLTADSIGAAAATLTMVNWPLNWHYKRTAPSGGTCSAAVPAGTSTANLTGLSGNTWHTFGAYYSGGCFWQIANVQFLTKPGKPATPTVSTGGGSGTLTLSSSVSGGGSLTKWQFARGTGGSFGPWRDIPVSSTTLSHTVSGLTDGTDYEFRVRAVNATGTGQDSDASAAAAPLDETLTAGSVGASAAVLAIGNWPGPWWHRQVSPSGGTCSAAVSAGTSTAELTGLSGNTRHSYRAYGFGGCNAELADVQFLTKPGKPAAPTVSTGGGSGTLRLSSSVSGSGSLTKWQYAQKEGSGAFGDWTDISSTSTTLSHTLYGLTNGTDYEFRVRAVNATGDGVESDASAAVAPLGETLTAGSVGVSTATLTIGNWTRPWWHNYTSPWGGTCSPVVSAGTSTVDLAGLSGNTPYTFHAFDNEFCAGLPLATAPAFLTKPGKAATPSVSTAAAGGDELTLSSSVSGGGTLTKWQYRRKEGDGSFGQWRDIPNSASTTLSHTVSGLAGGTVHSFTVRAVNETGDGLESDASEAVSPLDQTLTAGSVGSTSAALTIVNWSGDWSHKRTVPSGGTCSAEVLAGTSTVGLAGLSGNTWHTYSAYYGSGCFWEIATAPAFLTKPGKPSTPTVSAGGGGGTLMLSSSVSGSGSLTKWQFAQGTGGSFGPWQDIPVSSTTLSHTLSGLTDGTDYRFRVRAVNETGNGLTSDASAAAAPLGETLTASAVEAAAATLAIGNWPGAWWHRQVSPSVGTCSAAVSAGTSTADLTGLSGNTWHSYRAYGFGGCNAGLADLRFLTKPGKPTGLTATAGEGSGTLTLSAAVSGDGSVTKWQYAQKVGVGAFGDWTDIPNSASTTLSHSVSGLDDGTGYELRVRAVNATGDGVESDALAAVAPSLVADWIAYWNAAITLRDWPWAWHHKYTVPSGGICSAAVAAGTNSGSTVSDLLDNTPYTFTAYNDSNCTTELAEVQLLTKPGIPTIPVVGTGSGSGTLTLSSLVFGDGSITKWQYKQRVVDGAFGDWTDIPNSTSTTLSHTVSGLDDGTDYQFRVRAVNATGNGLASYLSVAASPSDTTLTAGSVEASTATLTIGNWSEAWWHRPISWATGVGWLEGTCSAVPTGTSTANLTGLSGNKLYRYYAYSDSDCTTELSEVQLLTKPAKPATPTVEAGGGGRLTLSSSVGASYGTYYGNRWQYAQKVGSGSFGQWRDIPNSASRTLSHSVSGLTNGTEYQFKVRVKNMTGNSEESDASAAVAPVDSGGAAFAGGNSAPSDLEETEVAENAWLAPFGRTAAGQTLDLLAERFATPPDTQFTLGGEAIPMTIAGKDAFHGWADGTSFSTRDSEVRALSDDELVFGSSFHLTQEGEEGPEGRWAIWGRASLSKMEDTDDGVSVSGEVTTGVLGADWERGRWLAGLSLTRSKGKGQLSQGGTSYRSRSTMTSVSPYLRLRLSERTFVWGLVGRGRGDMTMEDEKAPTLYRTDLRMTLTAAGMQSKLLTPEQTGGYGLDLKGDVFWVRTKSGDMVAEDGSIFLAATSTDSSRLRLALEGSRPFRLESGATLTPMVEIGVRHDGGDSETGAGLDFGGGIAYSGPGSRLRVELRAQTLLLHADGDRREWGISGSFRLVPGELGRGLSASLTHGRGADVVGSDRLWDVGAAAELAAGGYQSLDRLETEVGYGLSAFGGRFTQTPYLGYGDADGNQSMRVGWRLTTPTGLFETSLEANRRQDAVGGVDDGIDLLATARW